MTQYTYQEIEATLGNAIILRSDGACIPQNLANSDYQVYLKYLEENN
jgi:hypothetical protein